MTEEEIRKYTQRLPAYLHDFAREEAYWQRISLNEYIVSLVKADFEFKQYEQSPEHAKRLAELEIRTKETETRMATMEQRLKEKQEQLEKNLKQMFERRQTEYIKKDSQESQENQ